MAYVLRSDANYTLFQERQHYCGPPGASSILVMIETVIPEDQKPLLEIEFIGPQSSYLPGQPSNAVFLTWTRQWRRRFFYRYTSPVSLQVLITRIDTSGLDTIRVKVYCETT